MSSTDVDGSPGPFGAVHHVALALNNVPLREEQFWGPLLGFFGYTQKSKSTEGRMSFWHHGAFGQAIVLWETRGDHVGKPHSRWAAGLQHISFHCNTRQQVDDFAALLKKLGAPVTDEPAERGSAAFYSALGDSPDGIHIEATCHTGLPLGQ